MRIYKLLLSFTALLLLVLFSGCDSSSNAQNTQIEFANSFAGTFVNGTIDTNTDGFVVSILSEQGSSYALGPNLINSEIELIPIVTIVPCTTPNDNPGFLSMLEQGAQVITLDNNDQIFVEMTELIQCTSNDIETDPSFSFDGEGNITDGTGQFENATGSLTINGTGRFSISDTSGFFGSAAGISDGIIELNP